MAPTPSSLLGRESYTWGQINFSRTMGVLNLSRVQKLAQKHLKAGMEEMKRSFFKSAFTKSLQELARDSGIRFGQSPSWNSRPSS